MLHSRCRKLTRWPNGMLEGSRSFFQGCTKRPPLAPVLPPPPITTTAESQKTSKMPVNTPRSTSQKSLDVAGVLARHCPMRALNDFAANEVKPFRPKHQRLWSPGFGQKGQLPLATPRAPFREGLFKEARIDLEVDRHLWPWARVQPWEWLDYSPRHYRHLKRELHRQSALCLWVGINNFDYISDSKETELEENVWNPYTTQGYRDLGDL
ncbi:hypothetical protein BDD12DRAFT_810817 [Trichophaea hybrida]|nr:hypothetical protein BDD12DRAFT_810817 [Trichophaea hybrida]